MVVDVGTVKQYIKPKSDSTLYNMRKRDLIEYVRSLEHNCNVAVAFNENQAKYIESLGVLPKWIPASERLPEKLGLFLVIERHWINGSPVRRIAKWNTQDWFTADRRSREITPRVTHWMPLPEAPKEA